MADNFKYYYESKEIIIDKPSPDEQNWYTTESESFGIDKNVFVIESYNNDFPGYYIDNIEMLLNVISRSKALQKWYADCSAKYSQAAMLPSYLKQVVEPIKYKQISNKISKYNQILKKESDELEKESVIYKEKCRKISENNRKELDLIKADKLVSIVTMNTTSLPISMQIDIEKYTPKDGDIAQQRRKYARELLMCFQKQLATIVESDPTVDINLLIESLTLK